MILKMIKYIKVDGHTYLGMDGGLMFYEDKEGKVWGSSEESIARRVLHVEKEANK